MTAVAQMVVTSPYGDRTAVDLRGPAVLVGRPVPDHRPDIALEPDPRSWVGREHVTLHLHRGTWTAVDGGTVNGTILHRDGEFQRLEQETRLRNGDEVLILGDVTASGEPRYWRLAFRDPHATATAVPVPVPGAGSSRDATEPGPPCVEYDRSSGQVFLHHDGRRTEITDLRPQAHDLVEFMLREAERKQTAAVLCTHDELLTALFGDRSTWRFDRAHTEQDIRDVVSDARKAIEPDRAHPVVLQTVRGRGYRIVTCTPSGRVRGTG